MLKQNIKELVERHRKLYNGKKGALVYINAIKETRKGKKPLPGNYDMLNDYKTFIKDCFDHYYENYKRRAFIDDDQIPYYRPKLGMQEHSSFISGNNDCNVEFMGETSYHHQMVFEYEDLDSLYLSEENPYFILLKECYKYLNELAEGKCAVALRGTNLALDIANTIRGNDLLMDFYDDEEWTRKLLEFSNKAAIWYTNYQLDWVKDVEGGYVTGFGAWMDNKSVGHLAEDGTCLIGPDLYEEFCLPLTNEFLDNYDGCYMHVHSIAYQSIPAIIKNEKVKLVEISTDPNSYHALEIVKMFEEELKDKVLCLNLNFQQIKDNYELLKDKRVIIETSCKTIAEANELLDWVRNNLPIE